MRLLQDCGMPPEDADLIHGRGPVVNELLTRSQPRSTLFTGSRAVAEKLTRDLKGKVLRPVEILDKKIYVTFGALKLA